MLGREEGGRRLWSVVRWANHQKMGCGPSAQTAESETTAEINRQIAEDRRRLQKEVKLLLLGAAFSVFALRGGALAFGAQHADTLSGPPCGAVRRGARRPLYFCFFCARAAGETALHRKQSRVALMGHSSMCRRAFSDLCRCQARARAARAPSPSR